MTGGIGGLPPVPPFDCALPTPPPSGPTIDSVDSPQNYRVAIHGTGFLTAQIDGISLNGTPFGNMAYHDSNGPNAGLNPPGVTVTVTDTDITIDDVALGGTTINVVQLADVNGNPSVDKTGLNVPVGGTPVDYPLLETIQSQAPNSVTFTGQRFQTATAGEITHLYVRMASYATGCFDGPKMSVFLDGSPNSNGWVVDQFDDNTIQLTNPSFTDCSPDDASAQFTVNGVSFDAPNYGSPLGDGFYFYEPWGSMYSALIQNSPPVTTPEIDSVTGVVGHFSVNGARFVTSPDWVVNELEIGINLTPDLPEVLTLHAFDPSGPDAGTGDSAIAITSWGDTAVDIDFTLTGGDVYVVTARAYNQDRSEHFDFTVTPPVLVQNV